jgi:hypothetical protein
MIGSSDRRLSSLSGPNANRFLDRHNKNPAVIQSSCSGLTYNGLNRAPNTIIRDDDFKFKLRQKVAEVLAARRDGRVICPPTQHLYFADGYTFDSDFDQGFSYLVHSERFDNRLDLLHFIQMLRHFLKESNQARAIAQQFPQALAVSPKIWGLTTFFGAFGLADNLARRSSSKRIAESLACFILRFVRSPKTELKALAGHVSAK